MLKKINCFFLILSTTLCTLGYSASTQDKEAPQTQEVKKKQEIDIQKISRSFGHLIGKNLENLGLEFEMKEVIQGLEDSLAGKEPPMDEAECVQAISIVQEEAFQKLASKNLAQANEFLLENANQKDIIKIENNKLQYRIEKTGSGQAVEETNSPIIRYTGKLLGGKVFGASKEDELISLQETIPGFSKAIVGMKEGEKRTIFIHPDLGYGLTGYLPPNSLLVFEIEVIKANATPDEQQALTSMPSSEGETNEIATPAANKEEALR